MKYEVTDQRLPCVFFALLISVVWTESGNVFPSGEDFMTEKYISKENVSYDWAKPYFLYMEMMLCFLQTCDCLFLIQFWTNLLTVHYGIES